MAKPKTKFLGVFMAGEKPFPFQHIYKDSGGQAIPITGWTTWIEYTGPEGGGPYGQGSIIVSDGPNGEVTYTWHLDDFQTPGKHEFICWVEDGTNRLSSDLVKYEVHDGPGATPV